MFTYVKLLGAIWAYLGLIEATWTYLGIPGATCGDGESWILGIAKIPVAKAAAFEKEIMGLGGVHVKELTAEYNMKSIFQYSMVTVRSQYGHSTVYRTVTVRSYIL